MITDENFYNGGNSLAGIGVSASKQVIPLKLSNSTVKQMPVARKSVTGLSFGKNGQTSLSESIDKLGISPSAVTGSRSSRMTQLPFSFVDFFARTTGASIHPIHGLLQSSSAVLH